MKVGVDTNVLVYAHIPSMPEHAAVRQDLTGRLADSDVLLVLSPMILGEFVHVITDPRRFEPPLAMSEALSIAAIYLGRENVQCLSVGEP